MSEYTVDEVIEEARDFGAVSEDGDGDEIFYIVFANEPHRVWDFTERTLRQSLLEYPPGHGHRNHPVRYIHYLTYLEIACDTADGIGFM